MTTAPAGDARPPRDWEITALVLMVAAGAAALLSIVFAATDLAVRSYVVSEGESGISPTMAWVADHFGTISSVLLALGIGCLVGFVWWRRNAKEMLTSVGDRAGKAADHWTVIAFYVSFVLSALVRVVMNDRNSSELVDLAVWLGWDATQNAARIVAFAFLLFAIRQLRERVRAAVARSGRKPLGSVGELPSLRQD